MKLRVQSQEARLVGRISHLLEPGATVEVAIQAYLPVRRSVLGHIAFALLSFPWFEEHSGATWVTIALVGDKILEVKTNQRGTPEDFSKGSSQWFTLDRLTLPNDPWTDQVIVLGGLKYSVVGSWAPQLYRLRQRLASEVRAPTSD